MTLPHADRRYEIKAAGKKWSRTVDFARTLNRAKFIARGCAKDEVEDVEIVVSDYATGKTKYTKRGLIAERYRHHA
jgi:hypothetical protein